MIFKYYSFIGSLILSFTIGIVAQVPFKTVYGSKANYSISIPNDYEVKVSIGTNVDIKYVNSEGASIIVVVNNLPYGTKESDIEQLDIPSAQEFKTQMEANGLQNVTVINKGFLNINGVNSYFTYYRDNDYYYHSVTQIRRGKLINLLYMCLYSSKTKYMAYINRVINSLKS